jgi:hypothetical protein
MSTPEPLNDSVEHGDQNENFGEVSQIDCTHCGFKEYVPNDVGEKAVMRKIEYFYAVLKEQLSTFQGVNSLAHPYEENYDIYTAYH